MVIMSNLILSVKTKESDEVNCQVCKIGIMIPFNSQAEENHCFICNKCGSTANIDKNVEIE